MLFYRTLAGVGLGGEFGIGMALVAEAWPASKRARASSYVGLGWQLGVLAAAIVTPILLPVIGWRGMFVLGIFPAVAAYFIRSSLHEPEVFVKKSHDHPKESALHLLVKDVETTKLSLGMIILCSVQNFGYYGVMIWLPSYLSTPFRLCADAIGGVDDRDHRRHGRRHLRVRPASPIASAAVRPSSATCWAPRSWSWSIRG